MSFLFANPWRGMNGESQMTEADWLLRGHQQAMAMLNGLDALDTNPDEDGTPTGGMYNDDYPDSWHDTLNRRLEEDEYYEAEVERDLKSLRQASS